MTKDIVYSALDGRREPPVFSLSVQKSGFAISRFSGSSASKNSNCATIEFATKSSISVPKNTILSLNNLE